MNKKISLLILFSMFSLISCTTQPNPGYEVIFKDANGSTLYQTFVREDGDAYYDGELPCKESDDTYFYTFSHWSENLNHVKENIETVPVFTQTKRVDNTSYECENSTLIVEDILLNDEVIIPTHSNGEMIKRVELKFISMDINKQYSIYVPNHIEEFVFSSNLYKDYSNISLYFEGTMDDWAGIYKDMFSFHNKNGKLYIGGEIVDEIVISEGVQEIKSGTLSVPSANKISIPNSLRVIESDPYLFHSLKHDLYLHENNNYYLGNETNPYLYSVYADNVDYTGQDVRINEKTEFVEAFFHSNANNIYIHDDVRKLGMNSIAKNNPNVYFECSYLDYFKIQFEACIFESDNIFIDGINVAQLDDEISIPEEIDTLKSLSLSAFKNLKEITVPENIKTIERNAFACCERLEYVNLGTGVNTVKSRAFEGLNGSVLIPENVTILEENAFTSLSITQVFTEYSEKPQGWDDNWYGAMNSSMDPVILQHRIHWAGEWEYGPDGRPVLKQ